jgi:hypothetical protein
MWPVDVHRLWKTGFRIARIGPAAVEDKGNTSDVSSIRNRYMWMEKDMQDEPSGPYQLTLEGDGLKLERSLDRDEAHQILALVLRMPTAIALPGAAGTAAPRLSSREALDASQASSNPEKILAFAVHLERDENKPHFTRLDIKRCFTAAREPPPHNLNRDFVTAVSYGWIHEEANGRAYATSTGRGAIDSRFATVARKARRLDEM